MILNQTAQGVPMSSNSRLALTIIGLFVLTFFNLGFHSFAAELPATKDSSTLANKNTAKPEHLKTAPAVEVQAVSTTQVIYLHTDVLSSVIAESNAAGIVTKTTDYKPFGESKDN
jgi:hypothetical protein